MSKDILGGGGEEMRNSSVGIATCYGLDGPEIEPHCRPDISSIHM